jgi:hypothetical protein
VSVWICHTCKGKRMQHMGVPAHRAMHKRRKDGPVVMDSETHRHRYDYRSEETR